MATRAKRTGRLHIRLSSQLKALVEQAADQQGQTLTDFATATLVDSARRVLRQQNVTELSNRDRDAFVAILDDTEAKPNRALKGAVRKYKKSLG